MGSRTSRSTKMCEVLHFSSRMEEKDLVLVRKKSFVLRKVLSEGIMVASEGLGHRMRAGTSLRTSRRRSRGAVGSASGLGSSNLGATPRAVSNHTWLCRASFEMFREFFTVVIWIG